MTLKNKILKFLKYFLHRFRAIFRSKREQELDKKIEEMEKQVDLMSSIVFDQSLMIVSLSKTQAEIVSNLKEVVKSAEEDCFLIKIPIKNNDVVN